MKICWFLLERNPPILPRVAKFGKICWFLWESCLSEEEEAPCINYHRIVILYTASFFYFLPDLFTNIYYIFFDISVWFFASNWICARAQLQYNSLEISFIWTNLWRGRALCVGGGSKYAFCILGLSFEFEEFALFKTNTFKYLHKYLQISTQILSNMYTNTFEFYCEILPNNIFSHDRGSQMFSSWQDRAGTLLCNILLCMLLLKMTFYG